MKFEFDPNKDQVNFRLHGISLAFAEELDWDLASVWIDERFVYNELRMIALAPKDEILYYIAFVDRDEIRRPFSIRKATRREVKNYVENL